MLCTQKMFEQKSSFASKIVEQKSYFVSIILEQKSYFAPQPFERKSCFASIMVEQKSRFVPKMFEQKSFIAPKMFEQKSCFKPKMFAQMFLDSPRRYRMTGNTRIRCQSKYLTVLATPGSFMDRRCASMAMLGVMEQTIDTSYGKGALPAETSRRSEDQKKRPTS